MTNRNIWNQITTSLESTLSKSEINTWFSSTSLIKLDKDRAVIEVPNRFVASWLSDNYIDKIHLSFKENLNYFPEILFIYSGSKPAEETPEYKTQKKSRVVLNHQLNPSLTFSNFITAKTNRFAYSLALDVADRPAEDYNPLYIFSKPSSGKTHLLNAIGNKILTHNPSAKVIYTSLDQLSSEFSIARKNRKLTKFRQNYRNLEILLIDNIHLLTGREKLQKELITIFNDYYESKRQIVVAGQLPPGQIRNLLPELRSRLEWGLLSELQIPDHKTRMKIIKKKAKEEKIPVPDDVAFFLAKSTTDLKTLANHLISLAVYSSLNKRDINISTIKSIIKNKRSFKVDANDVQMFTATHFNISVTDILSNKKTHKFSYPRHMAMYLCRELTGLSFKEIARAFGNKDHSTIIYAVKRIEKDKEEKKVVMDDLNKLQNLLS
ncbi:MAG: chromosomal replication initiator protein DnaA [Deltaproteobacteria bacterium]|nr:chromosomal replication initiator protein DnaA [Deltaproteobacteria bacterium]